MNIQVHGTGHLVRCGPVKCVGLNKKIKEATQMRNDERIENAYTVEEIGVGLEAFSMAIDILD